MSALTATEQRVLDLIPDLAGVDGWTRRGAVSAIARRLDITQQAMTPHFARLRTLGLIASEGTSSSRRHRVTTYTAAPQPIKPGTIWDWRSDQPQEIGEWLADAKPGDVLRYHRGGLAHDAAGSGYPYSSAEQALATIAGELRAAAGAGLVHLVQNRVREGTFDYFAIARTP